MQTNVAGALAAGRIIAGCEIIQLLGRGGMGEVYLATHQLMGRQVALKVLPLSVSGNSDVIARFLKEAKLAAQVRHQNVVTILDVRCEGSDYFILMDYVKGMNLAELVEKRLGGRPVPWEQAVRLVRDAARGLAAVHARNLIHRDIKPANIMLSDDKQVLLMDFGLARELEGPGMTQTGAVMGTPAFMSPEQSRGRTLGPPSDMFSLGGTLYFLLTGCRPYDGSMNEVMFKVGTGEQPRPAHEVNPSVPRAVSDLVARTMAVAPADRPNAAALVAEIGQLLKAAPPSSSAPVSGTADVSDTTTAPGLDLVPLETVGDEPYSKRVRPLLPWAAAGVGLGVVVCLGVGAVLLANRGPSPTAGTEPTAKKEAAKGPDRTGMVRIPAGTVQIGNTEDELRRHARTLDGSKVHADFVDTFLQFARTSLEPATVPWKTDVPAFWMDKYEVTNAEYARFVEAMGRASPKHWKGPKPPVGSEQHPVTQVSHADAVAYAGWAGKRLPTQVQWVRAFRGDRTWMYPWGDRWEQVRANVQENSAFSGQTSPVGDTPEDVSPFGVCNLVGNVSELTRERVVWQGKSAAVSRGASWNGTGSVYGAAAIAFFSADDLEIDHGTGFRCVHEGP